MLLRRETVDESPATLPLGSLPPIGSYLLDPLSGCASALAGSVVRGRGPVVHPLGRKDGPAVPGTLVVRPREHEAPTLLSVIKTSLVSQEVKGVVHTQGVGHERVLRLN